MHEAYDTRFHLTTLHSTLSGLPPNSLLVSKKAWIVQERPTNLSLRRFHDFFGVSGLSVAWSFTRGWAATECLSKFMSQNYVN